MQPISTQPSTRPNPILWMEAYVGVQALAWFAAPRLYSNEIASTVKDLVEYKRTTERRPEPGESAAVLDIVI